MSSQNALSRRKSPLLLLLLALASLGRAGWAAPDAAPPVLFSAHGTFEGKRFTQNGSTYSRNELRTAPLSLPAGRYWFYADYHAGPQGSFASMRLLGADDMGLPGTVLTGFTGEKAGRLAQEITLTTPFTGTVEYGGGSLEAAELWFRIVPAAAPGFLPFGFGAVPEPLKKGAVNAARGTLSDDIGDFYYLSLPAGAWQVSLVLTVVGDTGPLQARRSSPLFGAVVALLDERGTQKIRSTGPGGSSTVQLVNVPFYDPGQDRAEMLQAFRVSATGYVKLRVWRYSGKGVSPVPPLRYVLALTPDLASTPPR